MVTDIDEYWRQNLLVAFLWDPWYYVVVDSSNNVVYRELMEGPVSNKDTGLIEVGGVYRARRNCAAYANPKFTVSYHNAYSIIEIPKGELAWFLFHIKTPGPFGNFSGIHETYQILYKERIYYISVANVFLNKDGPNWERVL